MISNIKEEIILRTKKLFTIFIYASFFIVANLILSIYFPSYFINNIPITKNLVVIISFIFITLVLFILSLLASRLTTLSTTNNQNIFEEKKNSLINELLKSITESENSALTSEEINSYKKRLNTINQLEALVEANNTKHNNSIDDVKSVYKIITQRIDVEKKRLLNSSFVNLAIALVTTIIAIIYLITTLPKDENYTILNLFPRITISLLIEILALFFLKQYRNNLDEIKYWHNESTNVDFKLLSLNLSLNTIEDDSLTLEIIKEFAKTDRNLALKIEESNSKNSGNSLSDNTIKLITDLIEKVK